ncbi:hypothetical protein ATY41_08895 [Leifsonia xyli subsp. xyli]|nr:aminotransferase class IV [Leifsonia xyli]ODA90753.1 hypothetical protein ATY41_08895 [Leifsonia xyli subsp. xyli]
MAATDIMFDWSAGALVTRDDGDTGRTALLVADSFLVAEGRALALGLHRERFAGSAARQGFRDGPELNAFWDAAVETLPAAGGWFPRFELARVGGALRLRFRLRTAPPLGAELVVATAIGDPRTEPDVKGPDIERLGALRQAAQRRGAQEAVILADGAVCDGVTTALLWWREGTLFAPPLSLARVDSVAARTVRGIAAAMRVPVVEAAVCPAALEGAALWAVNALHGIREVTAWVDGPALGRDAERTLAWRARFAALARPIGGAR